MFTELVPLLKVRALTITVAGIEGEQIRVNVVPHARPEDKKINEQISYSHKNEVASVPDEAVKALTTPISITGTAEEIDEKFPSVLTNYVESHVGLQNSFDRASSEISAAVQAIDQRNKAKTKEKQAKKDEKNKTPEPDITKDDTLPLWWTDPSASAPGTTQPASIAASPSAAPGQPTLVSQTAEVTQP
ncbi:MAG TPA: PRTRC system protein E [Candidatus Angelobacter sp.]|nr:PRTRC system protein E [Candidatus Angelobacter sp.]